MLCKCQARLRATPFKNLALAAGPNVDFPWMAYNVSVLHEPHFLLVEGAGRATLAELCGSIDLVATIASMSGARRALLNLLGVEIDFPLSVHLQLGMYAADKLRGLERVASVVPPDKRTGSSERAAQKMGLRLRTFTTIAEGMEWIAGRTSR